MLRFDHPRVLGAVVFALPWISLGCGHDGGSSQPIIENRPPVLRRFEVIEDRVHAAEEVTVVASATDPDQDPLEYLWSVNRGLFPFGRSGISVKWLTPDTRGVDTLTVRITDRQDTTYAKLPVALLRVFPPDSAWTRSYPSAADLSWKESPDEGIRNWVGYDVYMGEQSLSGLSEAEVEPYRITEEPIRTRTKRTLSLTIGTRYFFHVRSVRRYAGQTERSAFANEVDMSPRPSGDLSGLIEFGGASATVFDLSEGAIRKLDPNDTRDLLRSDVYVEADPLAPDGKMLLRSVSHLASSEPAWGTRLVELKALGVDYDISTTDPETGWVTSVPVTVGDVVAVRTPEGNYGKMRITSIQLFRPNRNVWFSWAYQTIPGYVSF